MAVIVESWMAEDLDLGTGEVIKTHPSGGGLPGHQISLSTFSRSGAAGEGPAFVWNPGVVVAGSQALLTVTVQGAELSDKVFASLTTLGSSGLMISAYVSAANEVTVILGNLTGSSQTIAEGTLSVLVFKHRVATP